MGYAAVYLEAHVTGWVKNAWLPRSGSLVEFGTQEFNDDPARTREDIAGFLNFMAVPAADARRFAEGLDLPCATRLVYEKARITYVSLDVNALHGARYFDLNVHAVPTDLRARFDMVNNEGTIEHLSNPTNGFQVAHELARLGGVMRHSIPLSGWQTHGICYPTLKYYQILAAANAYEVLECCVELDRPTNEFLREFNNYMKRMFQVEQTPLLNDYLARKFRIERAPWTPAGDRPGQWRRDGRQRLEIAVSQSQPNRAMLPDVWLHIAFRKTSDRPFVVPIDQLEGDDDGNVFDRLVRNFDALAKRREEAAGR